MTRYLLSPAADADLVNIWLYTARTWSADQADRYSGRLVTACGEIGAGRKRGSLLGDMMPGYLKLAVGSHFIIYRRETDLFVIVRILHQRMDIASQLQD